MKTIVLPAILIITFLGLISCKTVFYRSHARKLSIEFGSGGGFTGAVDEYILHGNGQVFKYNGPGDSSLINTAGRKETMNIFKLAESERLQNIMLDEPGNMSSFIRIYNKGKLLHTYQWPLGKTDLPAGLKELDNLLNKLIQK